MRDVADKVAVVTGAGAASVSGLHERSDWLPEIERWPAPPTTDLAQSSTVAGESGLR